MHNVPLFIGNVAAHLVALMSGIASFIFATIEQVRNKPILARWFWVVGAVCLLSACEQAWQDEHRNTQAAENDKAVVASQNATCGVNYLVEQALYAGSQDLVRSQRETIDKLQLSGFAQQRDVSSCVVSLGKMNPIVRLKITVIMDPFATMDTQGHVDPPRASKKKQMTELFVVTNVEQQNFRGLLACARPFTIAAGPFINSESLAITSGTPQPIPKGDRAYEMRVEQSNTVWNTSHPAYLRVISDTPNPGGCTFTQTE